MASSDDVTLIVCEDAGAAAGLAPVAARLERRRVIAGDAARAAFESRNVPVERFDVSCLDIAPNVTTLVTGSTAWGDRIEARALLAARAKGVRTVTYLDFWSSYVERLSYPMKTDLEVVPDVLAVVDDVMRDDLVKIGVSAERIVVTGNPAFDALHERRAAWPAPSGDVVLFLSQPLASLYGDTLGYTERSTLEALAPAVAELGMRLRVRPHPREDRAALASLVSALPGACAMDASTSLEEALRNARIVTGMTTMALVEAALSGRPTVSIQLGGLSNVELPTVRAGATLLVTSPAALGAAVRDVRDRGEALLPRGAGFDTGATGRLLSVIVR